MYVSSVKTNNISLLVSPPIFKMYAENLCMGLHLTDLAKHQYGIEIAEQLVRKVDILTWKRF